MGRGTSGGWLVLVCLAAACGGEEPSSVATGTESGLTMTATVGEDDDAGGTEGDDDDDADGTDDDSCALPCGDECCSDGESCDQELLTCAPMADACTDDNECGQDSYCDEGVGSCTPWPDNQFDPECGTEGEPAPFRVDLDCEWTAPPPGDPAPDATSVHSMPLVVDFGIEGGGHHNPSIVFTSTGGGRSVIRVIDGSTCEHQFTLDEYDANDASTLAVGDLDGDAVPEIVAHLVDGGLAAWSYDSVADDFVELWRSVDTTPSGTHSISLADLDEDGPPEIVVGALVYSATGVLLSSAAGQGDASCGGGYHNPGVLADVDLDGRIEIVQGGSIWAWDDVAGDLAQEPYVTTSGGAGFTAVADFGDFPGVEGDAPGRPEVVVMSPGQLRIQTIAGAVLFAPGGLPGGGDGGNITIADFDGDDAPEIGVVGLTQFVVYDPACGDAAWDGVCATGGTSGVLWQQTINENSCAIMGSTVFDFEGDGPAEVLYADECYVRVMRGTDGKTIWSHPRSSASWYEAPIVADVDGDFIAEMVVPLAAYTLGDCPGTDPLFEGLSCTDELPCPGGMACDMGLCRCSTDAECGDPEMSCTTPLPGSPGMGNVCRSTWTSRAGIRVYADENWAGSRPIWNQHAYSVTHVDDNGTILPGPMMDRNWEVPGLNNFRQNVQSGLAPVPSPDLTVEGLPPADGCTASNPVLSLRAEVCNRGPLPVPAGVVATFFDGEGGPELCQATTTSVLGAGMCEEVSCDWNDPPLNVPLTLHVTVDGSDDVVECLEGNNDGWVETQCPPPPQG